jgi:hypothetical protein
VNYTNQALPLSLVQVQGAAFVERITRPGPPGRAGERCGRNHELDSTWYLVAICDRRPLRITLLDGHGTQPTSDTVGNLLFSFLLFFFSYVFTLFDPRCRSSSVLCTVRLNDEVIVVLHPTFAASSVVSYFSIPPPCGSSKSEATDMLLAVFKSYSFST